MKKNLKDSKITIWMLYKYVLCWAWFSSMHTSAKKNMFITVNKYGIANYSWVFKSYLTDKTWQTEIDFKRTAVAKIQAYAIFRLIYEFPLKKRLINKVPKPPIVKNIKYIIFPWIAISQNLYIGGFSLAYLIICEVVL